jgi:hypothetical protein
MSFNRTLTAGRYLGEELNWKKWLPKDQTISSHFLASSTKRFWSEETTKTIKMYEKSPAEDLEHSDLVTRGEALMKYYCRRRRFFITSSGRFGLGPIGTKFGDQVAVLFGSAVPLVLRQDKPTFYSWTYNWIHSRASLRAGEKRYSFIGQAYVDGVGQYQGNIENDIKDGLLRMQAYHII